MTRLLRLGGISAVLVLLASSPAWSQTAPESRPPRSPAKQLPKLAVAASVQESTAQEQKNGGWH